MEPLQKKVIKEFSGKLAIEKYTKATLAGLWKSEEKLIDKYFKKNSSVLDVGCGTGRTTVPLFKKGYKVIGIDITPSFIKIAKKISKKLGLKINYEVGDATKLRFKGATFDNALFSFNGWTQIPGDSNRQKALQEIYRVLKPSAHFIFTTHIRTWKGYTYMWIKQWIKHYILKNLGFKIEELNFGDIFFKRDSTTKYSLKQYIHIPNLHQVRRLLEKMDFKIVFMGKRNDISVEDSKLSSSDCMFYVCKK